MLGRIGLIVFLMGASALWAAVPASAPLGIGRPLTARDIARNDLTVLPDGTGLPPGSGSAKQGAALFATRCAACHGDHGEGRGDFPALAGGRGSLSTDKPILTVGSYWPYSTTVWDYIRRAMPYRNPGSLSANEVYALTAYVLFMNGIVGQSDVLDRTNLPLVRMPNRDGFVGDQRADVRRSGPKHTSAAATKRYSLKGCPHHTSTGRRKHCARQAVALGRATTRRRP